MRPVIRIHNGEYGDGMLSLVTPLEKDSRKWSDVICFNTADPSDENEYKVTTDFMDSVDSPSSILVKDFGTLLEDYLRHPESKSLGPDGPPCTGRTRGLLHRMHIVAGEIKRISKECPRGLEEGDEPTEVMEFEPIQYSEKKTPKGMVQPSNWHVGLLRKVGYRSLIRLGCSRWFLDKVRDREFMRAAALRDYERAVREYKLAKRKRP
jgi:hypothetical protein